jgi:hypothetical protein
MGAVITGKLDKLVVCGNSRKSRRSEVWVHLCLLPFPLVKRPILDFRSRINVAAEKAY